MNSHTVLTRFLAITLLVVLSATWLGASAWVGVAAEVEWRSSDEDSPNETKEDVKNELKSIKEGQRILLLPGSLLLSHVNSQDGRLPTEHISEVPVPPPLSVR
jgi:hypothetical protein